MRRTSNIPRPVVAAPLRRGAALLALALATACGDSDPVEPGLTDDVDVFDLVVLASGTTSGAGSASGPTVELRALGFTLDGGPLDPRQRVAAELTSSGGGRDTLELRRAVCGAGDQRYWCDEVFLTLSANADTAALRARARQDGFVVLGLSATNALLRHALEVQEAVSRTSGWPGVQRAAASGAAGTNCFVGTSSEGCGQWWLWLTAVRGPLAAGRQELRVRMTPGDTITATIQTAVGSSISARGVVR